MKGFILGCDVSKANICVCMLDCDTNRILGSHTFNNEAKGIESLHDWCLRKTKGQKYAAVMEATGVYHENLCDTLYPKDVDIYIGNPKTIKHYIASHNRRYKNDPSDAYMIACFGSAIGTGINEVHLHKWEPFTPLYQELKAYSRQILSLKKTLVQIKNRMEALTFTNRTPTTIKSSLEDLLETIEDTIASFREKMMAILESDEELRSKVDNIVTIKGLGAETVLHVLCATDGFRNIHNPRQLTAYAGLDIPDNQSGRCRKPGHISKAGCSEIRQVMYMPALNAGTKPFGIYHSTYQRLYARFGGKGKGKKAIIAIMRKLLILMYVLWRDDCTYDSGHVWNAAHKSDKPKPELLLSKSKEKN